MSDLDPNIELREADLVFTRSPSWVSRVIRFGSRKWGEAETEASHVGGVVTRGPLRDAVIVEALRTVKRHGLVENYGGTTSEVLIARPINVHDDVLREIARVAAESVGMKYGYGKIAAHAADFLLFGANVFRRLAKAKRWPICSWVWAYAYKAADLDFGCDASIATPDDMLDFVRANPDKYEIVVGWHRLPAAA